MSKAAPSLSVLLLEDNPGDARLIEHHVNNPNVQAFVDDVSLTHVKTLTDGLEELESNLYDVLLLDLGLPESTGIETLERVAETDPDLPIIVLTGLDNEQVAVQAIQAGAQDYLQKGNLDSDRLVRALRYAVERHEQERELQRKTEQIEFFNGILRHDMLNGMNVIHMRGDLLAENLDGDHEEYAETIVKWSDNIIDLTTKVRSILDTLTSDDERELHPVALESVVADEADRVRSMGDGVSVEVNVPEDARIVADDLLSDVVGNVLTNAVEHGNDAPTIRVDASAEANVVTLCVSDDGPGIPDGRRDTIFEQGNTGTASTGTGFGLYFVSSMVDTYGGEVDVTDSDLGGVTIEMKLPRA
jgi:signal transduction histidine kinase